MLPSRTTILLLLLGLLAWLAGIAYLPLHAALAALLPGRAGWLPPVEVVAALRPLVFAFDGAILFLFLLDALLSRRVRLLKVRRERPARLSLGTENDIGLVLENPTGRSMTVLVRDDPPHLFRAEPQILKVRAPAHGWARAQYRLLPADRGNFSFGDVYLRCRGPLRLAWTDRTVPAAEAIQVYPNLLEVRRYEALVRTTLVRAGGYRTRRLPGAGREFSHFRDYTVDDDYRHVNWAATARRGKPITAVYESEHSQNIIFCLDVGRMMAARVGTLTKLDHAINAVLMLAHVSQTFQDNLGLLVFSHQVHLYLPPGKGHAQNAQFLQALYGVKPELCYVNYGEAFQYLIGRHPKRALTMVFTDLLDTVVSSEYREGVLVVDTVPERLTVDAVNRYLALKTGARI